MKNKFKFTKNKQNIDFIKSLINEINFHDYLTNKFKIINFTYKKAF